MSSSGTDEQGGTGRSADTGTEDTEAYVDRGPSLTPTYVRLVAIAIATTLAVQVVSQVQTDYDDTLLLLVYVLGGVLLLRELYRVFLLRRTYYRLTDGELVRGFEFFGRRRQRTIPVTQLRGVEMNQSRVESVLGIGTLRFLTGGSNRSLGFLTFDNVDGANDIEQRTLELVEEVSEDST